MTKLLTTLTFILSYFFSSASEIVFLNDSTSEIWLSRDYVDYYIDTTNNLTISDITQNKQAVFQVLSENLINTQAGASYWIRFHIHSTAKAQSFRIELFDFDIDEIEFYTPDSSGTYKVEKAGYAHPFHLRKIEHKNPGFNIAIPYDEEASYFMRFKSSRKNLFKPVIRSYEKTLDYGLKEYILLGVFYGLLLLMIFYNTLYFIILRKLHYLFYVLYALSILVYLMNRNGTAFQYLWPSFPSINPHMEDICLFTGTVSMLMFTIYFLDLKNNDTKLKKLLETALVIRIVILFIELINNSHFPWILVDTFYIQIALIAGIRAYRNNVKSAKWFILGFSAFNISFIITTCEILHIIPSSVLTVYSLNLGIILQFVFLSISIAESVKETFVQKTAAQADLLAFQEEVNQELDKKVKSRTTELERQKELVEEKNSQIMASVRYAKTIQTATLPNKQQLDQLNEHHFVLYMPRDIVSGDFYWTYQLDEDNYLVAAADCTGHGVPGAFMSMIGVNLLNRIVAEGTHMPNEILSILHHSIQKVLNQKENNNSDGMDIALCRVNKKEKILLYAGAKNPLVYIQNKNTHKIKASRYSIGGAEQSASIRFDLHTISFKEHPISFYLFSDGYADQFGGSDNRKFYISNMINLFTKNSTKPMSEQKEVLQSAIFNWMGANQTQIDDILIVGFYESA